MEPKRPAARRARRHAERAAEFLRLVESANPELDRTGFRGRMLGDALLHLREAAKACEEAAKG